MACFPEARSDLDRIFYHCLISTAAKTLHKRLSGTLASATFEYVTSENPGSILNKFSQDHTMATQTLPLFTLPSAWSKIAN